MSVDEAKKQLSFYERKGAAIVKEVILDSFKKLYCEYFYNTVVLTDQNKVINFMINQLYFFMDVCQDLISRLSIIKHVWKITSISLSGCN